MVKDMFRQASQKVRVNENDTSKVVLTMPAGFATPTFITDPEAEIWVNEEFKAKGSWTGRLLAGTYLVEARKEGHRAAIKSINLENGEVRDYDIGSPSVMYGILDLNTTPPGAEITINGKAHGLTPQMYPDFPVGTYEVRFSRKGYETFTKTVTVTETKATVISHQLVKAGQSARDLSRGTTQTPTQTSTKTEDARSIETWVETPVEDKLSGQGTELLSGPPKVPKTSKASEAPKTSKAPKKQATTPSSKSSLTWFVTPGIHVSANRIQSLNYPDRSRQFSEVVSCNSLSTGLIFGKLGFYVNYKTDLLTSMASKSVMVKPELYALTGRGKPSFDYVYEGGQLYLSDSWGNPNRDVRLPEGMIVGSSANRFYRRAYTVGAIWKPSELLHLKIGVGYGLDKRIVYGVRTLGTNEEVIRIGIKGPDNGGEAELGAGLDFGLISVSASVSTLNFKYFEAGINVGLSFTFRK
ncbi:MAG: PEGA domain-containing protein [Bacteroidales bacterium]|nr:PEGA domain-containing protein [Bacteroidales bacterium]MDI9544500.1 PEGA domain-containing protein [Bacteroidota bacterium]HOH23691.1 PEGA domain-containing protein [Bacteroidales bacterium]HPB35169.1 PEGA domain-containing protein [Bacteroidales bacterium]HPH56621.1 PEGA domain-containing protein [Bacteroidales bacterium]